MSHSWSVVIDGYRDLKLIASGQDSVVYSARRTEEDRPVAIKILPATQNALEIATRLGQSHPQIMTVLETRTLPDGRACVIMDYFKDGSLHDRLRIRGPLPHGEVITMGVAIAGALAYAHGQGVVHGDVKPQKVFALRESYVLTGFGLRAPGRPADDICALGSTLSTLTDMRHAPPALAAIVARCLSDRPEERFPDAASLLDALAALTALPVSDKAWAPEPAAPGVWLIPAPNAAPPPPEPDLLAMPHDPPPVFSVQPAVETPATAPRERPAPAWPRLAFLALISLLLGGLLTLGLAWVRGLSAVDSGRPVTSVSLPPSLVADAGRTNDPAIAPQITNLADKGTSLALTWTDRSGGKALFVVVEVTGAAAVPLIQVGAGRTAVTVEQIDPARPYCLAVLAVTETAQAISPLQCTGVRGTSR